MLLQYLHRNSEWVDMCSSHRNTFSRLRHSITVYTEKYNLFSDRASWKCGGAAIYVKQGYGNLEEIKQSNTVCDSLIVRNREELKTMIATCHILPHYLWQQFQEIPQILK